MWRVAGIFFPINPDAIAKKTRGGMFTGIIEELGKVLDSREGQLLIGAPLVASSSALGDSIAINGVDLTVAELDGKTFFANLMPETYRRSALGDLQPGDLVNLERSVRPNDRLSGHIVRGVTEGVGEIVAIDSEEDALILRVQAPPDLLRYTVVKGPVCIDGVSLTIIAKDQSTLAVSLVQYTQEHTNLVGKGVGARVNLETDILARYVEQFVTEPSTTGEPT
ncbi:MAG: riboflavin synthase [Dehalococcoidia bacterium]|nr:riboflavin synthase [Dehalococcoidia bacterium]